MKLVSIISLGLVVALIDALPFQIRTNIPHADEVGPSYNETDLTQVHYFLWTRSNPGDDDYYELLQVNMTSLTESPFDDQKRTYFIFHGWGSDGLDGWILDTKANLLTISDCQVISVDYSVLGDVENYDKAVFNMYNVADYVALYIDWLVGSTVLTTEQIHIIGYSLGGQAAGMTAKGVTVGLIDRVTGLDPAGPLFYNVSSDQRISDTDGSFVDIIHTNSGSLDDSSLSLFKELGHVDFYPNGGKHQPGCSAFSDAVTSCSHSRAPAFWVESILIDYDDESTKQFWSYQCLDYFTYLEGSCFTSPSLAMGYHVNRNLTGSFFLQTNDESPYAQGKQNF